MKKLKVMTILGTRPEIIRLSECIKACDRCFEHRLVHTGQNWDYTLNQVFFENLNLRAPDEYLGVAGTNLGETLGNILEKSYVVLKKEMPDALLILGDTNSALCAIGAKRLKIPVFHMEAGNRCFDDHVPEEINRRIVDHISDIHLPYTEHSRRYLLSEGIRKEHIFVTGSPMTEVIKNNMEKIMKSTIVQALELEKSRYILVSAHREENIEEDLSFYSLMNAFNHVAEHYQLPVIFSIHPRSQKKLAMSGFTLHPQIRQMKPFGYFDYNQLQLNAYCVLSDSGTLSEESAILGFPAVLLRTATERPEVFDAGTMVMGGITHQSILQGITLCRTLWEHASCWTLPRDYCEEQVSLKIVKLIQSYTHRKEPLG